MNAKFYTQIELVSYYKSLVYSFSLSLIVWPLGRFKVPKPMCYMLFLYFEFNRWYYRYHNQISQMNRSCQGLYTTTLQFCSIWYGLATMSYRKSSCWKFQWKQLERPFSLVFDRFEKFKKLEISTHRDQVACNLEFDLDLGIDLEK